MPPFRTYRQTAVVVPETRTVDSIPTCAERRARNVADVRFPVTESERRIATRSVKRRVRGRDDDPARSSLLEEVKGLSHLLLGDMLNQLACEDRVPGPLKGRRHRLYPDPAIRAPPAAVFDVRLKRVAAVHYRRRFEARFPVVALYQRAPPPNSATDVQNALARDQWKDDRIEVRPRGAQRRVERPARSRWSDGSFGILILLSLQHSYP
jgi:hypothetical protein